MGSLVSNIILISFSLLFLCFSQFYLWSKLYNQKIVYNSLLFLVSIIIMFLLGLLNYFFMNVFFRMIAMFFLFCICNFLIFKKKVNEIFISTIYGQCLLTLADVTCSLIVIFFLGIKYTSIREGVLFKCLGNFLISVFVIVISNFSIIRRFYEKLVSITKVIGYRHLLLCGLIVIISINLLLVIAFYEVGSIYVIVINSILIFLYSFIIYGSLNEKNNRLIVQSENKSLMKSLHQYEDMVDRQRVDNHENKNQLLIIRNMIKKKDEDVVKYIDTIVKDQKEDDEALYTRVLTIPSGGLQGIIYQKMLVMKDEHIKFSLDVGRGVKDFELEKLSMDDNYRLCKIVGVFLDNAIEESRNIDDKCIMISLFIDDDNLIIEVSNKFEGKVDIAKLDESGYTTKGEGHGYGLSLVKKILSETDVFENERCIKKNIFKQVIRIKNT